MALSHSLTSWYLCSPWPVDHAFLESLIPCLSPYCIFLVFLPGFSLWFLSFSLQPSHGDLIHSYFSVQMPPRWRSRIHDFLELLRSLSDIHSNFKPCVFRSSYSFPSSHKPFLPPALSLVSPTFANDAIQTQNDGFSFLPWPPDSITCYILSSSISTASPKFSFYKVLMATPLLKPPLLHSPSSVGAWLPCHQFLHPVMLSD